MRSVKLIPLLIIFIASAILWFFINQPDGLSLAAWRTLIIFIATIACIVIEVMPIGAVGVLGITAFALLNPSNSTKSIETALSELSSSLVWLVVIAFMVARGFIKTGLSKRIAYYLIKIMGKNTLGLSYGLSLADLALAPAIPSTTARSGGIIYPIANALAHSFESNPKDKTRSKIGTFLMLNISHVSDITSAMFLTAFTGNLLAVKLVSETLKTTLGWENFTLGWSEWFIAAIVPCAVSFIVIPLVIYFMTNPEIKKTPEAPKLAAVQLKKMGKITMPEWIMAFTVILLLVLWIFGEQAGINATTTAFIGLSILLLSGILTWDDIKNEKSAWDTLIWFSALLMMASQVNKLGVTKWLGDSIGATIQSYLGASSWALVLAVMCSAYVYLHYFFASGNAQIAALFYVFLSITITLGVPPMIAVFAMLACNNFFGSITQYANGRNPILFTEGYVPIKTWFKVGFVCSAVNLLILLTIGILWWQFLGF